MPFCCPSLLRYWNSSSGRVAGTWPIRRNPRRASSTIRNRLETGDGASNCQHRDAQRASFEKGLAVQGRDARLWHGKGVALAELGRHEEAVRALGVAVELDPADERGWFTLGTSLHRLPESIDDVSAALCEPLAVCTHATYELTGIYPGDWVYIESPRGRIEQRAKLTTGIDPRVVAAEHGWWFPELPGEEPWLHGVWESNANVLTQDDPEVCDPIHGGWPLKTALCKVYKVKTYEESTT
jgi:tetratricopeptide (TPR) repeat protein